ncbi:hypothetical protein XELAEV_18008979mg [Xenopus laevis]|uniref:Cadherin domain-containing protein n=1 Tax=Xenopus laevis TaxID=8355 RepID=A0A974DRG3_XENLA|nr:hypothetical protein XELAEV_18008979mg [Xenopus laevis]
MRTEGTQSRWSSWLLLLLHISLTVAATKQLLKYRIAEEGPADVRIGNVAKEIGIVKSSGDVTFSLESGSDYFKIDNVTGELSTTERRIDREKLPQCQMIFDENECFIDFEVSVIGPAQSWVELFEGRVIILDINDNTPTFPSPVLTLTVEENRPVGTLYLLPTATDRDFGRNGIERYELIQDAGESLYLSGRRGAPESGKRRMESDGRSSVFELQVADTSDGEKQPQLIVKGPLDREQRDSYELTLRVRDGGEPPRSSQSILRVLITDVNDNSPRFEKSVYEADLAENSAPGTPILQLRAADYDVGVNGQIEYVFGAATESVRRLLRLDENSVGDINDNPPVFSQAAVEVAFPENNVLGERVATVLATDADSGKNAEIAYSLEPPMDGIFSIHPDTGDITVNIILDREQTDSYEFRVVAKDKGIPVLQGATSVAVRVADRNDNEPKFMQDVFTFYVKENLQPNSPVGMVTVMDSDKGRNAEMSLFIEEDSDIFSIENETGTIYSTVSFDREHQTSYTFRVKAVDGGDPPRSATATVSLFVMDENDNAPSISFPINTSYAVLSPASNVRTVVASVVATDSDNGVNADLNYSIVGGNPFKLFEIDSTSGVVSLVGKLTSKHYGLHRLVVQVNDSGQPPQSTVALVHVFVNETISNATVVDSQIARSLHVPLTQDIAGDPSYDMSKQRLSIVIGVVAGIMTVILIILVVVMARYCRAKSKNGYEAGKKDHEDFFTPQQHDKSKKPKKDKKNKKSKQPLYSSIVTVEASKPNGQRYDSVNEKLSDSPSMGMYRTVNGGPGSPDLARHYKSSSPLPTVQLHPQSPTAGKKHQAVQDLPPANTFVGAGDNISIGSDHCSEYSQTNNKYSKQVTAHPSCDPQLRS